MCSHILSHHIPTIFSHLVHCTPASSLPGCASTTSGSGPRSCLHRPRAAPGRDCSTRSPPHTALLPARDCCPPMTCLTLTPILLHLFQSAPHALPFGLSLYPGGPPSVVTRLRLERPTLSFRGSCLVHLTVPRIRVTGRVCQGLQGGYVDILACVPSGFRLSLQGLQTRGYGAAPQDCNCRCFLQIIAPSVILQGGAGTYVLSVCSQLEADRARVRALSEPDDASTMPTLPNTHAVMPT